MNPAVATPAPWVVIVCPDHDALVGHVERRFDLRWVELIADRRRGERRRANISVEVDRRRGERRRGAPSRYRLTHEAADLQVYELDGRMAVKCPECDLEIEYELPHLGAPPAHLTVTVHHAQRSALRSEHVVEVEAFAESGRKLLSWRPQAWFRHRYMVPLF